MSIARAQNLSLKAYHFLWVDLKDVIEHSGGPFSCRARLFGYSRYLKILSEGTEPIQQ